ncbi:MAG: hypothetical protein H0U55_16260, partial [Rubrobacteraceae bacterium]|nr:hypothetical protein [Rubrobacteraceae bacterium]
MSTRVSARLVFILGGLILLLWVAGVLLLMYQAPTGTPPYVYWREGILTTLVFSAVGAIVATRRPRHPIGWLLLAMGLMGAVQFLSGEYAATTHALGPERLPYGPTAAWLSVLMQTTTFFPLLFLFLLFPTGQLLSSRWRIVAWTAACGVSLAIVTRALNPSFGSFDNPFGVGATFLDPIGAVAIWLTQGALFGALLSLVVRLIRSRGEERQQIKWFVAAAVLGTLALFGDSLLLPQNAGGELGNWLWPIVFASLPIAVGIGVLRYRLYDIDIIINRTLVYGALTVCIIGIYVLVVGYLGAVFQARGNLAVSIFAAGLVAVMFHPLRERLQRVVNRLTYGERDDPYGVLARLGRRLEATISPEAVLPAIVEDIALA